MREATLHELYLAKRFAKANGWGGMPGGWIYNRDGSIKYRGWDRFVYARLPEIKRWAIGQAKDVGVDFASTTAEDLANALRNKKLKQSA